MSTAEQQPNVTELVDWMHRFEAKAAALDGGTVWYVFRDQITHYIAEPAAVAPAPVCRRCGEPFHSPSGGQAAPPMPLQPEEALRECLEIMLDIVRCDVQMVGPAANRMSAAIRMAIAKARNALCQ